MLCAGNCQYMWRIYKTGELFCSGRIFVNCLFQFPLETSWNGNQVRLNQMNDPKVTAGECQVHKLTLITQEFMCILHFACLKEETKKGNNDDFFSHMFTSDNEQHDRFYGVSSQSKHI